MEKIILYIGDYFCPDIKRRRETKTVLFSNLELDIIEKIVVFYDGWDNLSSESKKELDYLQNPKIELVPCKQRQTYKNFYEHSKKYKDNVIVMANSDIIFDKTLGRTSEMEFHPKKLYAITRWERIDPKDPSLYSPPYQPNVNMHWSYDVYIFKHPLEVYSDAFDVKIGISGCDTYMIKKLCSDNLFRVENPMNDIRTWHQDYRYEKSIEKEYQKLSERYSDMPDYPKGDLKFPGIVEYGGQKGLLSQCTDCRLEFQTRPIIRRPRKIISFSLWGSDEKYTLGALKNAELALTIYPGWVCRYYVHRNVDPIIVGLLENFPNVEIIYLENLELAMSMRFKAIDDVGVDVMISRDCDSQLSKRERKCVDEWLASGKGLHIIRDHPNHVNYKSHRILGGMFGMRKVAYWPGWGLILEKYKSRGDKWGLDQDILHNMVFPLFSKYSDVFVHASFGKFESFAKDISVPRKDFEFIGEYKFYDGKRNLEHIELLKNGSDPGVMTSVMQIRHCVLAVAVDDLRLKFLGVVAEAWKSLGVSLVVVLVGKRMPEGLNFPDVDFRLFEPVPRVSVEFQVGVVRMLYAGLLESPGVIIGDIAAVPLSKRLVDVHSRFDGDRLVVYRYVGGVSDEFVCSYAAASSVVWREVFGVHRESDLGLAVDVAAGLGSDFRLFYKKAMDWNLAFGRRIVVLGDLYTNFHRYMFSGGRISGFYSDCVLVPDLGVEIFRCVVAELK